MNAHPRMFRDVVTGGMGVKWANDVAGGYNVKAIIVYFSQTGNTERIAKAIQTGIKQATSQCDLVKIREADRHALHKYDLIGIGSPVMAWEPDNVGNFVDSLRSVGGKHVFAFNTHGLLPGGF